MLSETALPMWQNWQRMQDWQPNDARLLSFSSAENETRVHYRYEYGGVSYRGNSVGVSEVKDNIGSWHRDMQAYLGRIKRSGNTLPIWVNPFNPSQSVIDHDMRWGLFALASGFCSVFILIGLGVIYASIRSSNNIPARRRPSLWDMRKRWQQAQADGSSSLGFLEFCQQDYAESEKPGPGQYHAGRLAKPQRLGRCPNKIRCQQGSVVFLGIRGFLECRQYPGFICTATGTGTG